jgi:hypothetical protein
MKKRISLLKPVTWLVSGNLHYFTPLAFNFLEPFPLLALFRTIKNDDVNALPSFLTLPA